jgi:hypothetical protein
MDSRYIKEGYEMNGAGFYKSAGDGAGKCGDHAMKWRPNPLELGLLLWAVVLCVALIWAAIPAHADERDGNVFRQPFEFGKCNGTPLSSRCLQIEQDYAKYMIRLSECYRVEWRETSAGYVGFLARRGDSAAQLQCQTMWDYDN